MPEHTPPSPDRSPRPSSHRVVIVAFEGVQSLDVAGPAQVFAGATTVLAATGPGDARPGGDHPATSARPPGYRVEIVSPDGGVVGTESAVRLDTAPFADVLDGTDPVDTLVIAGGFAVWRHAADPGVVDAVARLIERCSRLVTVCSGAVLAAATGALDGHRVTTHWARANRLAEAHPAIDVDVDPIFVHSPGAGRDVWSSAGVTAGIDLSLAIVEHDHSTDVAQEVARWLVMYLRRPGGQSQFSSPTWLREAADGPIRAAQHAVIDDPGGDHRVAALARRVNLSERHFVRRFTDEVGIAPARYVSRIRLDAARHELERSDDTVAAIAARCGFGSAETLRRTLHRHLGVSPDAYRARFGHRPTASAATPSPSPDPSPAPSTAPDPSSTGAQT